MLRALCLALPLAIPMGAGAAQDIAPVISPGQAAEGIYHRSMMEEQAARDRARNGEGAQGDSGPTAASADRKRRICAERPKFRRQFGAAHPKVRQLDALCKRAGF